MSRDYVSSAAAIFSTQFVKTIDPGKDNGIDNKITCSNS